MYHKVLKYASVFRFLSVIHADSFGLSWLNISEKRGKCFGIS